jgi:hypothetical protein
VYTHLQQLTLAKAWVSNKQHVDVTADGNLHVQPTYMVSSDNALLLELWGYHPPSCLPQRRHVLTRIKLAQNMQEAFPCCTIAQAIATAAIVHAAAAHPVAAAAVLAHAPKHAQQQPSLDQLVAIYGGAQRSNQLPQLITLVRLCSTQTGVRLDCASTCRVNPKC